MTYDQLINAVSNALRPRVAAAGGELVVAQTLETAHKFLSAAPNRWRLILHWEGFGDHEAAREGMTSHQVATVIHQADGLLHRRGEHATNPLPSGDLAFSARITQVVSWMTALRFPNGTGADSAGFSMSGSQWLSAVNGSTAHTLNWKLDAALPGFEQHIILDFPHLT
jgi:hypothetical protein